NNDDNVSGINYRRIFKMIKDGGSKEVHVRIASPPIESPCYYCIDMSTREELIAANYSVDEICKQIGADSVAYLSTKGLEKAIIKKRTASQGICNACMTGNYPVLHQKEKNKSCMQS